MRGIVWAVVGLLLIGSMSGCSSKKSSLLLERPARGQVVEMPPLAHAMKSVLVPATQTKTEKDVEVTVTYASHEYLENFFADKAIFGPYAGKNPFYPEHLVLYVKIANKRKSKILIRPEEFVMVDDFGNQFSPIGMDYVTALGESKQPMATATRGVLSDARPGYFGFSFPVGKVMAAPPQGPFALMKQSALQPGFLYPGVVYDGLLVFWAPAQKAKKLNLYLSSIKGDFDAKEEPSAAIDFVFDFALEPSARE